MTVNTRMVERREETRDDRLKRSVNAPDKTRVGDEPGYVAVNTLPSKEPMTTRDDRPLTQRVEEALGVDDHEHTQIEKNPMDTHDDRSITEKIGDTLTGVKTEAKEMITPDRPARTDPTRITPVGDRPMAGKDVTPAPDWDSVQHPGGCGPESDTDYGTRPVSELTPPAAVKDKADLAAIRMMERGKADHDRTMAASTMTAAAGTPGNTARTSPAAGERTTRQGAAVDTGVGHPGESMATPTVTLPLTTATPGVAPVRTTPMSQTPAVDPAGIAHAHDETVHQDWERFPAINAPRDVGIPTAEGQADAARLRAGDRRSDEAKEPRIDRRGGDYEVPAASGANREGVTEAVKDTARDAKAKARDLKEDVDRKI